MATTDNFEKSYKILNPQQKKAVDTIDGPVFVMAGPGTGKTQILTLRIANILQNGAGVQPENILALTFTNTASHNMRQRLSRMIGSELAHRIQISTFHSFAEDMIKKHIEFFPDLFRARMASDIERIKIVEDILDNHKTHYFSVFKRRSSTMMSLVSSIDKIKNEGLTPDEFRTQIKKSFDDSMNDEELHYKRAYRGFAAGDIKPAELKKRQRNQDKQMELADIYEKYQSEIRERGLYDYSDLIVSFIQAMREHDEFRAEMHETFQYILVDEHQDTNDAQNIIVHLLIDNPVNEGKPNIFVVGDDKQAIYRFAGASQSSFKKLQDLVDDMTIIDLVHNYRSGQHVLDRAHGLIVQSENHNNAPELQSYFSDYSGEIQYREFSTHKMELVWLAQDIKRRTDAGEPANEMAILYRNNRDAYDVQHILGTFGIEYQDRSKKNILADPDMMKLFLLFRVINNMDDDHILARALYIDFLGFDAVLTQSILRRFRNTKKGDNKNIFALISDKKILKDIGANAEQIEQVSKFTDFLTQAKMKSENETFLQFFMWCVRESGFLAYMLSRPNAVFALAKIEKLFDEVKKESVSRDEFSFKDFIHYVDSLKKYDIKMEISAVHGDGVHLMTFHGAKGLEFDTVYIIKAMDKRSKSPEISLPFGDFHSGGADDERRLFYVGLTRARKNIMMSSHRINEQGKEKSRIQFIDQLDGLEHVETEDFEKQSQLSFAQFFEPVHEPLASITNQEYIQEKFLTSKLSVSALNNYFDSPILYFFRNLIQLPDARSPFLDFGNLIHGTLEGYFEECKNEKEILNKDTLRKAFDTVLVGNPLYQAYSERGWDKVSAYFDAGHSDFVVPSENEYRVPALPFELSDGQIINLTGVVDKITHDKNGDIVVWDYKTGKSYSDMDKPRREKIKRQATFYKLLLSYAFDGRYNPQRIIFDFIEPSDKTGEYEQQEFIITDGDIEQLSDEINQLAQDIFSGNLLKHTPEKSEKTADYIELLDMIQGDFVQGELFG
ncbi:MAG: ATP-dependent helicase [Candidatus Nomurabacteria bacterium]|nr:ATP-dependent helicase [Candidatus Nomurabacteria bacterium]